MIRFYVNDEPVTDWLEEGDRLVAVDQVTRLRREHGPEARIRVERDNTIQPRPSLFRYDIFVPEGVMMVVDDDGTRTHTLNNVTLQSRTFQATERDAVLADLQAKFPKATLTEVKL